MKRRETWLGTHFSRNDYSRILSEAGQSAESKALYFENHPEDLALLSHSRGFFESAALPLISYRHVEFNDPKTGQPVKIPDCMESAILNAIINPLVGGMGNRLDITALEGNLRSQGYELHPGFKAFLETYSDPSRVNEIAAHKMWAELVTQAPGVAFVASRSEMFPTVSNALKVFEFLFYSHPIRDRKQITPSYNSLSRSQKLNRIFDLLSHDGKMITWGLSSGFRRTADRNDRLNETGYSFLDTNLTLSISFNGKASYDWRIDEKHSEVDLTPSTSSDWRTGIGYQLSQKWRRSGLEPQRQVLLSWLLESDDVSDTLKSFGGLLPRDQSFVSKMPTWTAEQKLRVIQQVLNLPIPNQEVREKNQALVEKLFRNLPNDLEIQQRYHAMLADAHYPLGFPENAEGYSAATEHELNHLFGSDESHIHWAQEVRKKLGYTVKSSRGLYWGETLLDERYSYSIRDKQMDWATAKNECLNLNPPDKRSQVQNNLDQIENDSYLKKLRRAYMSDRTEESKTALLARYHEMTGNRPVQGCYLAPLEEYLIFAMDCGFKEHGSEFKPKFRPHIYGKAGGNEDRRFWSSSGFGGYDGYYVFTGNFGNVSERRPDSLYSIACSCGAAEW